MGIRHFGDYLLWASEREILENGNTNACDWVTKETRLTIQCLGSLNKIKLIKRISRMSVCIEVNEENNEVEKSRKRESEGDIRNPN